MSNRWRSLFLSDIHLRTRWCKSQALYEFLVANTCDNLFLVGDIIDTWNVHQGYVDAYQCKLVGEFIDHPNVKLIIGNHEHDMKLVRDILKGIPVFDQLDYKTLAGSNLVLTHGHHFDAYRMLNHVSLYRRLYGIASMQGDNNRLLNYLSNLAYTVLEQNLTSFKRKALTWASLVGYDGVITGHTHFPEIDDGFYNCGDWLVHCSALAEDFNGEIKLIQ